MFFPQKSGPTKNKIKIKLGAIRNCTLFFKSFQIVILNTGYGYFIIFLRK